MISKEMGKLLNEQLNLEFYSSYIYLGMSAYCSDIAYSGSATWFKLQAKEELEHAMKLYDYILDQGGEIHLTKIEEPERNYSSLADAFSKALEQEQSISASINKLMGEALKANDYATSIFLQWFVTEQIEEEANVGDIVGLFSRADTPGALFMIDRELAKRAEQELANDHS